MQTLSQNNAETTAPGTSGPAEWGTTLASIDLDHRRRFRVSHEIHEGSGRIVLTRWRRRAGTWQPDKRQTIALGQREIDTAAEVLASVRAMRRLPRVNA